MVIHINNDLSSSANAHTRQKSGSANTSAVNREATASATESAASNTSTDKHVQLSQEAQTIERLETKIQNSEGVDTAKVDLIKQRIADGSYEVNSERLAEKLLNQDNLLG